MAGEMIMPEINLPNPDRTITAYRLTGEPIPFEQRKASEFPRVAYAAAHVVADPLAANDPWLTPAIDWDTTLEVPAPALGPRARRRRGDGHGAARHGARAGPTRRN